jgi:PST family polysaccharide transporter
VSDTSVADVSSHGEGVADQPGESQQSLKRDVGRGAIWAAGSNIALRFASIAVTALLARLLSKEDFGVFAVALAVFLVVSSLAELGMASAIARAPAEPEDIAPTVTSISVGVSAVLGAMMAAGASPLASALGQPAAAEPIRVLAICLVLTGIFAVPGAQLVREFRQDRIFLATIVGFVVANPILVVLAVNGGGATAFAWSRVVGQLATGLVFVACISRRYLPGWRRQAVGSLIRFGLPLSFANLVNWTLLNADYMIIGRLLPAAEVGVYMIAFNVANWSTAVLGSVLNSVVVPAFGRVSGDRAQLGRALRSSSQLVALVSLPIGAMTLALSAPVVETVFGAKWLDAAPVLVVLSIYGVIYAFSLLFANVLVATGATMRLLSVQIAWVVVLVPSIVVGLRFGGLEGAAWAHVVAISVVAIPVYLRAVLRATGQRPMTVLRAIAVPALAASLGGGAAWCTAALMPVPWLGLLVGGTVGVTVYAALSASVIRQYLPARIAARLGFLARVGILRNQEETG